MFRGAPQVLITPHDEKEEIKDPKFYVARQPSLSDEVLNPLEPIPTYVQPSTCIVKHLDHRQLFESICTYMATHPHLDYLTSVEKNQISSVFIRETDLCCFDITLYECPHANENDLEGGGISVQFTKTSGCPFQFSYLQSEIQAFLSPSSLLDTGIRNPPAVCIIQFFKENPTLP